MREKVVVNNKEYTYVKNYRDNEKLREGLNELTEKTYGFNFRKWYESGYWGNGYIPYSLLDGEKLVANISVSIMKVNVLGEKKNYIQIGTVMTDEEYRKKGLSKFLMEKVLSDWEGKCDCIYLFANDTVLNFYPKFGFKKNYEYQYSAKVNRSNCSENVRKINVDNRSDKELLENIIRNSKPIAKLHIEDNKNLVMFYCLDFLKDNIYYIEDYNTVVICEYEGENLFINDIFTDKKLNLNTIIDLLINEEIKTVKLGFTPINSTGYDKELLNDDNDTLFVKYNGKNIFEDNDLMFPVLSHA